MGQKNWQRKDCVRLGVTARNVVTGNGTANFRESFIRSERWKQMESETFDRKGTGESVSQQPSQEHQLKDAAMLLRIAVTKLRKGDPRQRCFAIKVDDWLQRNGLQGSILRGGQTEKK